MDLMKTKGMSDVCTRDDPVYCTNACPLGVDVKSMAAKIQKGDFQGAYKVYRNIVLFPEIISRICDRPCDCACIRGNIDDAINIKGLERAVCDFAENKELPSFHIPKKSKTVAVIGAGLGGISCAVKLARRGYTVHLYEQRKKIGGGLFRKISDNLPEQIIHEELHKIASHDDIHEYLILHLNERVTDLDTIDCDAIYIATGKNGDRFDLQQHDPISLSTARPGVFMNCFDSMCESILTPIRQGILVSTSIEGYLKVSRMEGKAGQNCNGPTRLAVDTEKVIPTFSVKAAGNIFSRDEAIAEANRCLLCECRSCLDHCEMLTSFKKYPHKVVEDVLATVNAISSLTVHLATRQISSCNQCGLCKEICPTDFDFEDIFLESRRKLYQDDALPPAFHDFWIKDMLFSQSEEAFLSLLPVEQQTPDYMFFPGCQLGGSDPDYVIKTYQYLNDILNNKVSILVGCCGAPARWAGDEDKQQTVTDTLRATWQTHGCPEVIVACPTCKKVLSKSLPEIQTTSLYSIIADKIQTLNFPSLESEQVVSVFDPCASRYDPETQENIRKILSCMGYRISELPHHGNRAQCCGFGGQIHAANRDLMDEIAKNRVGDSPYNYVTYCTNCRDIFAHEGKETLHILDVLLFDHLQERLARKPVSLSGSRLNRIKLKEQLQKTEGGPLMQLHPDELHKIKLIIEPDLMDKMDRELILEDDAKRVILFCETTGSKLLDQDTGNFVGHLRDGVMTYWVNYRPEKDNYRILSIYCHRMKIEEIEP